MATGKLPFRGTSSAEIFVAIMHGAPVAPVRLNPDVPPRLEDVINKSLEKDRNLRYQHASEMRTDLQRLKRDTESRHGAAASALLGAEVKVGEVPVTGAVFWKLLLSAAVLFVPALISGALYFRHHHAAVRLTDKDTIVFGDFDNKTGDSVFDDTLRQGLAIQLEQSPFLGLISERKVNETLKLMGRPPETV